MRNDFLVELQTAELPPKALHRLASRFLTEIKNGLTKLELSYGDAQFFATPRRLAVYIKKLTDKQADSLVDRKGPALEAAFDKEGKPTPACSGFARSCGVTPEELITIKTDQGAWVGFSQKIAGKTAQELLPTVVQQALALLPIPKRMRWGSGAAEFVRPVYSVMMLYGDDVIDAEILGCRTGRQTRGHRFHSKGMVSIAKPARYVKALENKYVMADFEKRKAVIRAEAIAVAKKTLGDFAEVKIQDDLLDEVTGLVEWPVAICGNFDATFLSVPQEALISAMQDHQRYFPVTDHTGKLLPHFIAISNIESRDPARVIAGNERVLRARLSDAAFFFETDKKHRLDEHVEKLKHIIFQAKLGTLFDKTQRISTLAASIAEKISPEAHRLKSAAYIAHSMRRRPFHFRHRLTRNNIP